MELVYDCFLPGGGGGFLITFLGGSVPAGPENPYLISDQKIWLCAVLYDVGNVWAIHVYVCCYCIGPAMKLKLSGSVQIDWVGFPKK